MCASTLAHRTLVDGAEVALGSVEQSTLRVVHRTYGHTDIGDKHVVQRHIGFVAVGPLQLLQAEDTLVVDDVGVGAA